MIKIVARCIRCGRNAKWIRTTQFAGEHAFCKEHAKAQKDYKLDDGSYSYWYKVNRKPKMKGEV